MTHKERAAKMSALRESAREYYLMRQEFMSKESPRPLDSAILRARQEELAIAAVKALVF